MSDKRKKPSRPPYLDALWVVVRIEEGRRQWYVARHPLWAEHRFNTLWGARRFCKKENAAIALRASRRERVLP